MQRKVKTVFIGCSFLKGWIQAATTPVFKNFFSYSQEIVIPQYGQIFDSKVSNGFKNYEYSVN